MSQNDDHLDSEYSRILRERVVQTVRDFGNFIDRVYTQPTQCKFEETERHE